MVYALDRQYADKLFKKRDKEKIGHLISDICDDLISEYGIEELKPLHDKYSDFEYDALKQDADELAGEFLKSMVQDLYGVDLGDDLDVSSPEKFHAFLRDLQEKETENQRHSVNSQTKRKKTKKQLEKENRLQQEEQNISQSIREVYRKLTSALHPDRESDPAERERKTGIMQQVNAAYAKKDLLRLLELQLQAEQIDQSHLNNITEDRLKSFNKILKGQLAELQLEIQQLQSPFIHQMNLSPDSVITPKVVLLRLRYDIREIKANITTLKNELKIFQTPAILKAWLKNYQIPKQAEYDDLNDIFLEGFKPPF